MRIVVQDFYPICNNMDEEPDIISNVVSKKLYISIMGFFQM